MKRVLVLDDDAAVVELMRVVFEEAHYGTIVVDDPGDLPSGPFDCVVTDLMSARRYSTDTARDWIRRLRDRYANVPIILVTAHAAASGDGEALGVQGVIMKPFDVDQLLAAVQAAIEP